MVETPDLGALIVTGLIIAGLALAVIDRRLHPMYLPAGIVAALIVSRILHVWGFW